MNHAPGSVTSLNRKWSRPVTPSGSGRSGAACLRVRCGRWAGGLQEVRDLHLPGDRQQLILTVQQRELAAVRRLKSLSARAMWTVLRRRTAMWPTGGTAAGHRHE